MSGSLLFGIASAVAKGPRGRGCAMHRTTAGMDFVPCYSGPFEYQSFPYTFASL